MNTSPKQPQSCWGRRAEVEDLPLAVESADLSPPAETWGPTAPGAERDVSTYPCLCVYLMVSRVDAEFSPPGPPLLCSVPCMRYRYVFSSSMSFRQWSSAAAFLPCRGIQLHIPLEYQHQNREGDRGRRERLYSASATEPAPDLNTANPRGEQECGDGGLGGR